MQERPDEKALCLVLPFAACAALPAAAEPGVNVGGLTCDTSAAIDTIVMQRQDIRCVFAPADGGPLQFSGHFDAYGLAIGMVFRGKLAWACSRPHRRWRATGSPAPIGPVRAGVVWWRRRLNLLVGDTNNTLTLQPLSAEGHVGANVVGGIARMTLVPTRETRVRRVWDRWDD